MNNNNDKNRQDPSRQGTDQGRKNEQSGHQTGDKMGQQKPTQSVPGQAETSKIKKGF